MSLRVWLCARTLGCLEAGGHLWVYLNWALGLKALGCQVVWLEQLPAAAASGPTRERLQTLRRRLAPYGLGEALALCGTDEGWSLPAELERDCVPLEALAEADLLLDMAYGVPAAVLGRSRRSVLLDIDPGLLQLWISRGQLDIGPHDVWFTIGETVGSATATFPDCGLDWVYTPPCVALEHWPARGAVADAPFTTVSNWYEDQWVDCGQGLFRNDKKTGFEPYLDLPSRTEQGLELALCLGETDAAERAMLERRRWRVRHAWDIAATPCDYRSYVQTSRGEFSCAKPSCVRLQNAWVSDRTLCYLASGKPAIVQHTGPSRFLPDAAGLLRFRDPAEAVRRLAAVAEDYDRQCALARELACEHFDARTVVARMLERAVA